MTRTLITIPVYNGADFIERTLNSCLQQSLQTDIWVVDNVSTDDTQRIVKEYAQKHSNIRLLVNDTNYGRMGNWNRCLALFMESNYDYIKFVFSGDEILPNCIEASEKAFAIDAEIGAVAFPYKFVNLDGSMTVSRHQKYANKLLSADQITIINLAEGMLLGAIICNVYSKSAVGEFRFDEQAISKAKFDIEVLENKKVYYLDKVLAKFNLDAHRTFASADSSYVFMEFSFIEAKEHARIAKTSKFSAQDNKYIEQRIIQNMVNRQLKFMTVATIMKIVMDLFRGTFKQLIMRFICGK